MINLKLRKKESEILFLMSGTQKRRYVKARKIYLKKISLQLRVRVFRDM